MLDVAGKHSSKVKLGREPNSSIAYAEAVMGLDDYQRAVALMNKFPDLQYFVGPRSETVVNAAEKALGLNFPPSYRRFVLELGAGSFCAFEVYGVIDDNFESSSVPNGIWRTLEERQLENFPLDLVIVGEDGAGGYYCLQCRNNLEEGPIVAYHGGYPPNLQTGEIIGKSFGEFLLQLVQEQLELHGQRVS